MSRYQRYLAFFGAREGDVPPRYRLVDVARHSLIQAGLLLLVLPLPLLLLLVLLLLLTVFKNDVRDVMS